jgi:hypothetical protein
MAERARQGKWEMQRWKGAGIEERAKGLVGKDDLRPLCRVMFIMEDRFHKTWDWELEEWVPIEQAERRKEKA